MYMNSRTMAQPQTPSQSRAEWNRAEHSLLLSSAPFSLCCYLTPSVSQRMVCTFTPEVMDISSNFHASEQRLKVRKVLIRELLFADDAALTAHAHWGCFKATYQLLRAGLVSPTVSRRPTSLAKMLAGPQTSPLATTLSRWWRSLCTSPSLL